VTQAVAFGEEVERPNGATGDAGELISLSMSTAPGAVEGSSSVSCAGRVLFPAVWLLRRGVGVVAVDA
jgi:hypothetical protein